MIILARCRHGIRITDCTFNVSVHTDRIIATELHGAADDGHRYNLKADRAVREELPHPAWAHPLCLRLFLQHLLHLAGGNLTAPQTPQRWWCAHTDKRKGTGWLITQRLSIMAVLGKQA